jgi:hypothetical protein
MVVPCTTTPSPVAATAPQNASPTDSPRPKNKPAVRPECIATVARARFAGPGDTVTMKNAAAMVR